MAKILVVDDAEFLRMRISKMLVTHGHTPVEADNGTNAIQAFKAVRPDMVLLDITMPDMDGLSALKEIKATDPQAKVVMLSALGQDTVVLEAIRAGAVDFVVKPFDPNRVLTVINKTLGQFAIA